MVQGRQTDGSPVMVKMYFNNQETKEERSLSRFDLQEEKERRTRVLNAQREEQETDSDICYDSPEEEDKGILVQSCDDRKPRAMRKDTDSDPGRDSELVGNHRRGQMTSGPRRKATPKAKRLSEGNHGGTDVFGVNHSSQQSDPPFRWLSFGASGGRPSPTDSAYVVPKCS